MLSSRNSDSEPGRRDHNYMQHDLIHRCLGSHKSLVFFFIIQIKLIHSYIAFTLLNARTPARAHYRCLQLGV